MSKYSSKNATFQFGLLLFMVAGLSFGIILTTGKASLIFSPSAQVTGYSTKPEVPTDKPRLPKPPIKNAPPTLRPITNGKCIPDGWSCTKSASCCGFCSNGICLGESKCIKYDGFCTVIGTKKCCDGSKCKSLFGGNYGLCQ